MKLIKPYFLLASLLGLTAACTETEILSPEKTPEIVTRPDQREVLLTFENKLVMPTAQQKQASTRATVPGSPAENKLDAFDIYVFGSATEGGAYTFQQKLSADDMELNETVAGSNAYTAVLRPTKGLFVKLYCVGNSAKLYSIDALPDGGTFTEYTAFTELEQKNGAVTTPGVPTEAAFLALTTASLGTTGVLASALPMTGAVTAPLDLTDFSATSRLSVGLKLTRAVARFDVVNNGTLSKFTIYSIGLSQGRPAATLFPLGGVGAVQEYAPRVFSDGAGATVPSFTELNGGVANAGNSAFYIYPTVTDGATGTTDPAALVLTGTYQMNLTTTVDVTYRIPFDQVRDGNGLQVHINPNHRYVVKITDADPTELKFTISVADWASDDNLNEFEPENGMKIKEVVTANATFDQATNTFAVSPVADDVFGLDVESSTAVTTELTYVEGATQWLELTTAPDATTRTADGKTAVRLKVLPRTEDMIVGDATLTVTNGMGMKKIIRVDYLEGIHTAEGMYAFGRACNEADSPIRTAKLKQYGTLGSDGKWTFKLLEDIEMNTQDDLAAGSGTAKEWIPIDRIDNFDGGGHSMNNMYLPNRTPGTPAALFLKVSGVVKNIDIDVWCGWDLPTVDADTPDAAAICHTLEAGATIANVNFMGEIHGCIAGGICAISYGNITNCTVTSGPVVQGVLCAGGICGEMRGGTITASFADRFNPEIGNDESIVIGGIAGKITGDASITACRILAPGSQHQLDGGICGLVENNAKVAITACYSYAISSSYSITEGGSTVTIKQCYAELAPNFCGISNGTTLEECFQKKGTEQPGLKVFSATNWPGDANSPSWQTSTDGAGGAYWKSLGSWENEYPKLYWEK